MYSIVILEFLITNEFFQNSTRKRKENREKNA